MANNFITPNQYKRSIEKVKEYVNNSILLEKYNCIPYKLFINEDEYDTLIGEGTVITNSITEEIFNKISKTQILNVYIKLKINDTEQSICVIPSLKSGVKNSSNTLEECTFKSTDSYPCYDKDKNSNYINNNIQNFYCIKNKVDNTFTLKFERIDFNSLSIISEIPNYYIKNDKNNYVSVNGLETTIYNVKKNNDDTSFILKTDIGNIDIYSLYGDNILISCTVIDDNVKLLLPDRIITGTKNGNILNNTTITMFSDSIKKYVDDSIAANISSMTDEEFTKVLTDTLVAKEDNDDLMFMIKPDLPM